MRYVCHIYEDGSIYLYETTDRGQLLRVFEGKREDKRISAFAEIASHTDRVGPQGVKTAFAKLQEIAHQELGE